MTLFEQNKLKKKIYSKSKVTCFKCGNDGHLANVCKNNVRAVYESSKRQIEQELNIDDNRNVICGAKNSLMSRLLWTLYSRVMKPYLVKRSKTMSRKTMIYESTIRYELLELLNQAKPWILNVPGYSYIKAANLFEGVRTCILNCIKTLEPKVIIDIIRPGVYKFNDNTNY
ncbi:hypothetical protein A3Q56_06452 [Intoshia linei]|uniref:CCHC-type domain-containing protein n=1 Tax=Intoshia linei TaxID=1819745 RepID=A0A177AVD1_9BILA|nr:hypothetical protein A3Q56_06452 [Intoshia linei]